MTITTRVAKGSKLSHAEMDTNFTDLRDGVSGLMIPKTAGLGIKVDSLGTPTFSWKSLIGDVNPKNSGANAPTQAAFRGGNARAFFYSANDNGDATFVVPYDYAAGTDMFLHIHWGHNGTAISGSFVVNLYMTYAKGHNQTIFPAEVNATLTVSTPDIATIPRWGHRTDDIQITAATPSAAQIDTDLLEPGGIIQIYYVATTIPTITGGTTNEPVIFGMDIDYQTKVIGTKNREPDFYA
jgi:hypothetical protein